jgi:hypothetical protein
MNFLVFGKTWCNRLSHSEFHLLPIDQTTLFFYRPPKDRISSHFQVQNRHLDHAACLCSTCLDTLFDQPIDIYQTHVFYHLYISPHTSCHQTMYKHLCPPCYYQSIDPDIFCHQAMYKFQVHESCSHTNHPSISIHRSNCKLHIHASFQLGTLPHRVIHLSKFLYPSHAASHLSSGLHI